MSYYIEVQDQNGKNHIVNVDEDPSGNTTESNLSIAASVLGIGLNVLTFLSLGEVTPTK